MGPVPFGLTLCGASCGCPRRRTHYTACQNPGPMNNSAPFSSTSPAPERVSEGGFSWPVRIYYEDTDAGGVVYYANYLRFFERCRSEWMRALGFGQQQLAQEHGVLFVVAEAQTRYLRPARLDDELRVEALIAERFASYVIFSQRALRGTELLATARVKVACVDARTMRPTRLPAILAERLPASPGPAAQTGDPAPSSGPAQ